MNFYLLASGIISLMAVIGHFTMGKKLYLNPVLNSNIDEIPKNIMHGLFHYASVVQIISSIVLLGNAFGCEMENCMMNSFGTVRMIGFIYAGFAIVQLLLAVTSKIDKKFTKLFQWIFWVAISILAFMGTM